MRRPSFSTAVRYGNLSNDDHGATLQPLGIETVASSERSFASVGGFCIRLYVVTVTAHAVVSEPAVAMSIPSSIRRWSLNSASGRSEDSI